MNSFSKALSDQYAHARDWIAINVALGAALEQAAVAALCLLVAFALRRPLGRALDRFAQSSTAAPLRLVAVALPRVAHWLLALLLITFAQRGFAALHLQDRLLRLVASLVFAWVAIRLTTLLVRNATLARAIAIVAWLLAALNIAGLLGPTAHLLDAMSFNIGTLRLSVLLLIKGALLLVVLLWAANLASRIAEQRLAAISQISPSLQVLAAKLLRITLLTVAVVVALGAVGIDLTAFAVFSGAIGVGLGFGLQKVVSNLVSGVILLLDRSIKPGDVIQLEDGTYGWITRLNARFVSVVTRDGTEYLIPNEDLITQRVINWSYSNDLVRLHVPFGVSYNCDLRQAVGLALQAVADVPRVLAEPAPVCLCTAFGDSSVDLELRFWIADPREGTANVMSDVLLRVWDVYHDHDIELPFPQRDLHFRNPEALAEALVARRPRARDAGPGRGE